MKLTILGCSGSAGGPMGPTSGYLVSVDRAPSVLMDVGPGVLSKLQEVHDPNNAHVVFSHLHADHCLDFPSLMVWRRYHPTNPAKGRNLLFGPRATVDKLGRLTGDAEGDIDMMDDSFAFSPWEAGKTEIIDRLKITPYPVIHPIEAYALRVEHISHQKVIAYSGDSAYTENLVECARGADIFLCEATWGDTSEGKAPNMHMCGAEAGELATKAGVKKLVLIHIPPWGDAQEALESARRTFDGEIVIGQSGMEFEL